MNRKTLLIGFLFVGATAMLLMSFHYLGGEDSGILKNKPLKDTLWYRLSFLGHIAFGLTAMALGPFQFVNRLLQNAPRLHRGMGFVYCLAVAGSGATGLVIAQFAMGGLISRVGFSVLSLLWLGSLGMALKKIWAGDVDQHKYWMTINYALTFSSITQRSLLLFAFIPAIPFLPVYQLSAWLPWMVNVAIALSWAGKRVPGQVFHR